jgi:arsenite-transporting ATPase
VSPARILLFTGKGGVGTTTIAAATAVRVADAAAGTGRGTLLVSSGPAALGHLLDAAPAPHPVPVVPGLWAEAIDVEGPPSESGRPAPARQVAERARSGDWATIVLDLGTAAPLDATEVSARLVLTAERLAVAEARRRATRLALYGHAVDEVVANRLLPDRGVPEPGTDPWIEEWRRDQADQLADIEETFAAVRVLRARQATSDPAGVPALRSLARQLYGDDDPSATPRTDPTLQIVRAEGGYRLTLTVPFVSRDAVDLARQGDELLLGIDGHERRLLLPDSLRRRAVRAATFRDGCLVVDFADPP